MTPRQARGLEALKKHAVAAAALVAALASLASTSWNGASRLRDVADAPERISALERRTDSIVTELSRVKLQNEQDRRVLYYTACRVDAQPVSLCASKYLAGMDRP